jgi:hypothetical protein
VTGSAGSQLAIRHHRLPSQLPMWDAPVAERLDGWHRLEPDPVFRDPKLLAADRAVPGVSGRPVRP